MKYKLTIPLLLVCLVGMAQQQTFDLATFTPPAGWTKTSVENVVGFSTVDETARTWAQINIVKSTASAGSIDADFQSEWSQLVVKPYGVAENSDDIEKGTLNGWQAWSGTGSFVFNNENAFALLQTFSNGVRCMSIVILSNTMAYRSHLEQFIGSIQLPSGATPSSGNLVTPAAAVSAGTGTKANAQPPVVSVSAVSDGFQFNTTNFDDGWTSVLREDWVEATKGNVKVLLHFPRKEDSEYISQQDEATRTFWNLLVAPRYVTARDFFLYNYNNSFEPGHLAHAYLTDKDGRTQFVALFMKAKSGWIEVITPDKDTFVKTFGVDRPDSFFSDWERLSNLAGLNRFGVGGNDLVGKWSSDFSSTMSYYNTYTGAYSGYHNYSSNETFIFGNGSYEWKIAASNSINGAMDLQRDESAGTYRLNNNWQLYCSKIGKNPKTYDIYFKAIKGGRILFMKMTDYGGYTAYGKVK